MRVAVLIAVALIACKKEEPAASKGSGSAAAVRPTNTKSRIEQIDPPIDIKTPPADAIKTASGLLCKKLVTNDTGAQPKRNDTVVIHFNGWNQRTGETFNTTRGRGQPQPLPLNQSAPGFVEGLQLMRTGEKAVLWIPPALGYVRPPTGTPETLVYEVELVEIQPAPAVPPDVAAPPENALALASGTKYLVVTPGATADKDKARSFDTVTFTSTSWDAEGRMIENTRRPKIEPVYKQTVALEEVMKVMGQGTRVRFWVTADKMSVTGKPAGTPSSQLCYEIEVTDIKRGNEPPSVPAEVAKPPADAKKSPKGVSYKILRASSAATPQHPKSTDRVKVHYTGWTTDGRMFDSSVVKNEPTEFSLGGGVIPGWTDGIPMMATGEKMRMWIPEELAYKGVPNKPQGMLVFDVELLEIKTPPPPKPHGG